MSLVRNLLLGAAMWLSLAFFSGELRGQSEVIPAHSKLKGVSVPVYLDFNSKPVALFRAKAIFPDHQRRGFFRIGVLPMLAGEDVTIQVYDAERAGAALSETQARIKGHSRNGVVELRRVAIQFPDESGPRLQAALVRFQDDGQWQVQDFTLRAATNTVRAARGRLQISGEQAGRLSWETSAGPATFNLFSPSVSVSTNNIASVQRSP